MCDVQLLDEMAALLRSVAFTDEGQKHGVMAFTFDRHDAVLHVLARYDRRGADICTHYAEHRGRCVRHGIPSCLECCRNDAKFRAVM